MSNPGIIPIRNQTKNVVVQNIQSIETENNQTVSQFGTFEQKLDFIRKKRNKLIEETIWIKEKYECQLKEKAAGLSSGCDISQSKFEAWLMYWKELRNIPNRILSKEISINDIIFPVQPK